MERKISEIDRETPGEPHLSVVIPAYNEEQYLPACLRALRQQKDAPPFEVIVVDNASTDSTACIAGQFGAHVVAEPRKGVARARQSGFEAARAPIVASTDADTIVPRLAGAHRCPFPGRSRPGRRVWAGALARWPPDRATHIAPRGHPGAVAEQPRPARPLVGQQLCRPARGLLAGWRVPGGLALLGR